MNLGADRRETENLEGENISILLVPLTSCVAVTLSKSLNLSLTAPTSKQGGKKLLLRLVKNLMRKYT